MVLVHVWSRVNLIELFLGKFEIGMRVFNVWVENLAVFSLTVRVIFGAIRHGGLAAHLWISVYSHVYGLVSLVKEGLTISKEAVRLRWHQT